MYLKDFSQLIFSLPVNEFSLDIILDGVLHKHKDSRALFIDGVCIKLFTSYNHCITFLGN